MIFRRRAHALVLAVPVLLAGCGGDVLAGNGTSASGSVSQSGGSSGSGPVPVTSDPQTSAPSSQLPSSAAGSSVTLTSLTGTATTVQLDPTFVRALTALRITPGLLGPAKLSGSAVLLPVTGGRVSVFAPGAPQAATASVDHAGSGLTLTAGQVTISITGIRIDLGDAPQLNATVTANGKVVVRSVTVFDVDDASVRATGTSGTATVSGVVLRLDSGLADLLNTSFKTQAFTSGLRLGTATLALTGR